MKESVLDILIHLFENFLDAEDEPEPSRDALQQELERAGYPEREVERARGDRPTRSSADRRPRARRTGPQKPARAPSGPQRRHARAPRDHGLGKHGKLDRNHQPRECSE